MKNKKKIVSLVLSAVMISTVNLQPMVFASEPILAGEDFENVSSVSELSGDWEFYHVMRADASRKTYAPVIETDSGSKVLRIDHTSDQDQTRAVYKLPKVIGGAMKVRFSMKPGEDTVNKNITTMMSLSESRDWMASFNPDKSLSFIGVGSDTIPYTLARSLSFDKWFDVEVYADFVGKKSKVWISDRSGNSWESDYASIKADSCEKIYFRCWGQGDSSFYIDNVEVERIPVGVSVETDKVGNIFDQTDDETFAVVIRNDDTKPVQGMMEWSVRNEYTDEVLKGISKFNLLAKRDKNFNLTLDVKKFGTYTLTVKLKYYKDGVLVEENVERDIKFSKIFASNNGEQNPQFGFATANVTLEPGTPEQAMQLVEKAGANGIRAMVTWKATENANRDLAINAANQSVSDAMALRKDMDNIITLGYGHRDIVTQTKLQNGKETEMDPSEYRAPWKDEDIADFVRYCQYVAQNTDAKIYEIWNEWDGSFNTDLLPASNYVKILKAAYEGIKAVRPDALVLSNAFGGNTGERGFQDSLNAGMYEYCDGFVAHGYMAQSYFPSSKWLNKYQERLQMLRDYESEKGYTTQKKIYFNENGISTAIDYKPKGDGNWRTVTEATQAEIAVKYVAFLRKYNITDKIHWFTLTDTGVDSTQKEDMWGVMYHPKNFEKVYLAKPAYASIAAMNRLMNGGITNVDEWDKIETKVVRDDRWNNAGSNLGKLGDIDCYVSCAYAFERGADDGLGNNIAVLWNEDPPAKSTSSGSGNWWENMFGGGSSSSNKKDPVIPKEYTLKLGCETVDVYDLFGNKTTLTSADGVYTINVDNTVKYLLGDFTSFEEVKGSISVAEYDANKNIMHIAGFVKDSNVADGSTIAIGIYEGDTLVQEITTKVNEGTFDTVFSFNKEGNFVIKAGNFAEKEFTVNMADYEVIEKVTSVIDSGVSVYIDSDKRICIDGTVNNYAEDENVSIIVVPEGSEVVKENFLYIKQVAVANDGTFSDKIQVSGKAASVDIYLGATNASAIKTGATQSVFKVQSLNLEETNGLSASAVIYNTTDIDEDAVMIIAQYTDKDQLVTVSMKDIKALKSVTNEQVFNYTVDKDALATKYKAFIWKSGTDITPLFGSVTIGE